MVVSRSRQMHLFWGPLLLGLAASIETVTGQRIKIMCPTLSDPTNGQVNVITRTVGSVANYTCNTGYILTGAEISICVRNGTTGQWTPEEPTCAVCPLHTVPNGMVMYSMSEEPPPVGTVATYSCDTGYDLTGNRMRICVETTGWSGTLPVCSIVDCGALTHPLNGQVDISLGTTYSQVATYSCDTGYNRVGSPSRICQANGMWSSTAPDCEFIPLSVQTVFKVNNSAVAVSLIGEGASTLACHTELTTCCREQDNPSGGALGEWRGPDSNRIPESSLSKSEFYVTRQQSSISLNRGGIATVHVGGTYCCVIPRLKGDMTFCVQVQVDETSSTRRDTIVGLSVGIALTLMVSFTTITILVIMLIIFVKHSRTQHHHSKQVNELPDQAAEYENMDVGGAGAQTCTPTTMVSVQR